MSHRSTESVFEQQAATHHAAPLLPTSLPTMTYQYKESSTAYTQRPELTASSSLKRAHCKTSRLLHHDTAFLVVAGASETTTNSYRANALHQSTLSIEDGSDISNNRRTSRRRRGPLSQQARSRAALIRQLGACSGCRRRRVACHPSHHHMTWEDLFAKFHRPKGPKVQDIAQSSIPGRVSTSPVATMRVPQAVSIQNVQDMDIHPGSITSMNQTQLSSSDLRICNRFTPVQRLEKPPSLPGIEILLRRIQEYDSQCALHCTPTAI